MKNTILIAALVIGLLLFAGSHSLIPHHPRPGDKAPELADTRADSIVQADLRAGDYVIVNFWNSSDAESRRAANVYRAWKRRVPAAKLKIVGVNFDSSDALFREIVRLDSLEPARQVHVDGPTADAIRRDYGLRGGYGAVLIGPDGHIVATNPSDNDLDAAFATTVPVHRLREQNPNQAN